MIKSNSVVPLYEQLSLKLQQQIDNGELKPGEQLSSINELVKMYNVSRVTIVNAIEDLVKKGCVISRQGKGTFVCNNYIGEELLSLRSFKEIKADGKSEVLSYEIIAQTEELAEVFSADEQEIVRLYRLQIYNDKPVGFLIIHLPKHIVDSTNMTREVLEKFSIFEHLDKHNVVIVSAQQSISACAATAEISKLLQVPKKSPILHAVRKSCDAMGNTIMYTKFYYRSDSYGYSITLNRKHSEIF